MNSETLCFDELPDFFFLENSLFYPSHSCLMPLLSGNSSEFLD